MKEKEPNRPEKKTIIAEAVKKCFDRFLSLSDEPGEFLTDEEKNKLIEESKADPAAMKKFEENKNSKYRINSLSGPLGYADLFLESKEADHIPPEKKEELIKKIDAARNDVARAGSGLISKKEVDEVIGIVEELEPYLK
ncbi:MAG: hypothetical protein AAB674_00785 [Patescibacteria group bacterium]